MVIKNIIANCDVRVNTQIESRELLRGDTAVLKFANEVDLMNHLTLGHIAIYNGQPKVAPPVDIPVIEEPNQELLEQAKLPDPVVLPGEEVGSEDKICCDTIMLLTTDDSDPKVSKQVLYCSVCQKEEVIGQKSVEDKKSPRSMSRCSCGKVKSKDAAKCKKCTAA